MSTLSKIVEDTIGQDSFYILEKSGNAVLDRNASTVDFAVAMLNSFKNSYQALYEQIRDQPYYHPEYYEYEFKLLFFAIDKLSRLLKMPLSEENELEASMVQSFLRSQNDALRAALQAAEEE